MEYLGRPIFTMGLDWGRGPLGSLEYDLRELAIGQAPPLYWTEADHPVRGWDVRCLVRDAAELQEIQAFFEGLVGPLSGFWLPSPDRAAEIIANVSASAFRIRRQGLADLWPGLPAAHLWMISPAGQATPVEITAVTDNGDDTETVTLNGAISAGPEWSAHWLHYVRLTGQISWEFIADGAAICSFRVVELPHEYAAAETGAIPIWYYELRDERADETWYYTSWVEDLPDPMGSRAVYAAAHISHGTETRAGVEASVGTELRLDASLPPARAALAGRRITVRITRMYIGEAPETVWQGVLDRWEIQGRTATAQVSPWPWSPDDILPRRPITSRCPWALFGPGCGLDPAPHTVNVVVTAISGRNITCSGSFPAVGAHYYAAGTLRVGGRLLDVTDSTAPSSGQVVLTLARYPAIDEGSAGQLRPGCDGRYSTCVAYGNQANFGGLPAATRNLSIAAMPIPKPSGGKK